MSGTPKLVEPGNPPLIWSNIEQAFRNINQNFNDLYATIQADGSTQVVNFSNLFNDVAPGVTDTYKLGDESFTWKELYISEWSGAGGSENNGVWLGTAQIRGIGGTIELPSDSTVNGNLIIDPDKTFFKTIDLDGTQQIVADQFNDTLNFVSGTAISLSGNPTTDTITIENIGVTEAVAGQGISVDQSTGSITFTNTGVTSATNSSTLPTGRTAGAGIASSSGTGAITLTNTGILDVQGGFGITVSVDSATGIANVVNTSPAQVTFRTVHIQDDDAANDLVADSTADTLNISAGTGIVLTNTPGTDTLDISLADRIDITGSIFADDSTLLVDAVDGVIRGPINTTGVLDGELIGSVFADDSTLLVDGVAGIIAGIVENTSIFTNTITGRSDLTMVGANTDTNGGTVVVVGGTGNGGDGGDITLAAGIGSAGDGGEVTITGGIGSTDGGEVSITGGIGSAGDGGLVAISGGSGGTDGGDVTIYAGVGGTSNGVINIGTFNTSAVNIDNAVITGDLTGSVFADDSTVMVNAIDNTLTANSFTGNILTSTIDSSDSSEITVVPAVVFNSDVTVENDLLVDNIPGYVSLATLKAEVAASTNFADFQSRIAAL